MNAGKWMIAGLFIAILVVVCMPLILFIEWWDVMREIKIKVKQQREVENVET